MRLLSAIAFVALVPAVIYAQSTPACPAGTPTSISGTVYAPNGNDPLPNVTVYVSTGTLGKFADGVPYSCPAPGSAPPNSMGIGTVSDVDGSFQIFDVPVGTDVPLVITTGRWRRQINVSTTACENTLVDKTKTSLPKNQSEGEIPKIAIVTGRLDSVECILRKSGISESEFTDPSGPGRINLFSGDITANSAGARISTSTDKETTLMNSKPLLNSYDVLMLPCQGTSDARPSAQLSNFRDFVNGGGRVYASHWASGMMVNNSPFNTVVNWAPTNAGQASGTGNINLSFGEGATLAQWLQIVGATTTLGQMQLSSIKHSFNGVNAPTKSWMTYNFPNLSNETMQFTFDAPIGDINQCGRVLFNEYHVEEPGTTNTTDKIFPAECPPDGTPLTPQEKLLEYSLFSLTADGGDLTLTADSLDFGNEYIGSTSAPKTFTWKNNSSFSATVKGAMADGPFSVISNGCRTVASGDSCSITVAFKPNALGSNTGTVYVASNGKTLTAAVTGNGVAPFVASPAARAFGSYDVGYTSSALPVTLTNLSLVPLPTPPVAMTGDFFATATTCGANVPGGGSCTVSITFRPTASGARTGTFGTSSSDPVYSGITAALTGNGIDFSIAVNPMSANVIAGYSKTTVATITPIAGFAAPVTVTCSTTAPGSTCTPSIATLIPTSATPDTINITTTSRYTVVGYGGLGAGRWLWIVAFVTGALLLARRKTLGSVVKITLVLLMAAICGPLSGCAGKLPAQNTVYTAPGSYTYTVTATDGFLTRSATFTLTVTIQ